MLVYVKEKKSSLEPKQRWICSYLLGKMMEKKKNFNDLKTIIRLYLNAEKELMLLNDISNSNILCTIKFRVAATIYKFVNLPYVTVNAEIAEFLMIKLKRFKLIDTAESITFNSQPSVDANANEVSTNYTNSVKKTIYPYMRRLVKISSDFIQTDYWVVHRKLRNLSSSAAIILQGSVLPSESLFHDGTTHRQCLQRQQFSVEKIESQ